MLCECNDSTGEICHFLATTDDRRYRASCGDADIQEHESSNDWSCHFRTNFEISEGKQDREEAFSVDVSVDRKGPLHLFNQVQYVEL